MIKTYLFLAGLFVVSGCAHLYKPNYRVYESGNMQAGASLRRGEATYHTIRIGGPEHPYDATRSFYIKDGSGSILKSDMFTHDRISLISDRSRDGTTAYGAPRGWERKEEYIRPATIYSYDRYEFVFADQMIVLFRAIDGARLSKNGETFIELPMSEGQLIDVFGEPDSTRDMFFW